MRWVRSTVQDVKFQMRHGFYLAYLFVCALYVLLLRNLPADVQELATTLILFSDPCALGSFFIGGIVLLERGQNILDSLFVTPLRVREYLVGKVLSLGMLSALASMVIEVFVQGVRPELVMVLAGVLLSSFFFTLLGASLAVRVKSVNAFLCLSPFLIVLFYLPVLETAGVLEAPWFSLLPSTAALHLIQGTPVLWEVGVLIGWIAVAYRVAYGSFQRYVILRIGGTRT